ncbi:altered inheritance rate of mitochondria protein 25 isoform X1 [Ziziphus jujuba]|uniref:Altered inheritance rate of mitochondria protein 25 isoform X1 n=1 Tax=Ziziphus jujuba TaxID=326968 RepID=A0A6P3ZJ93_ZIZJJ|nr:altered inheritance rate of mitochondria protein 25-like [Ziziphus jujuba var. spinosa]XP_015878519.1 altered inheritance rate of mitochondria protein 25-like [Ziziphus jujuba var. spinosa]XP_060675511.1 altered inheritance rate of mitochondria protein 25 isoform X1 [Ziziphus jujuba]XP_060675512.1 altered inheritance rate of mitochondria protein 25 isoform X1 [Ziziphus jujuba]
MNWKMGWCRLSKVCKSTRDNSKFGSSFCYYTTKDHHGVIFNAGRIRCLSGLQSQRGFFPVRSMNFAPDGSRGGVVAFQERLSWAKSLGWGFKLAGCVEGNCFGSKQEIMIQSRRFGQDVENDPGIGRNYLAKLWVADRKMKNSTRKRGRKLAKRGHYYDNQSSYLNSLDRLFSGASVAEENSNSSPTSKRVLKQPPLSQSITGFLEPESPEEAHVAPLLARSNLLITRDIEWANLVLGFEQENRYAIVDVCYPESPVGFIREQSNFIARQLLRLRRPFVAFITDGMGNELFRVRRPFWWITSSIYAEINGKEVGVVHRRWHLWRRIYDLYLGNKQFAVVENPGFWNWTFTLKDIDGNVLAEIDRDWRGFGFEIFTDAGQYVIRFGSSDSSSKTGAARQIEELEVARPLTLSERAVCVALAISLDNDYFSRHGGWGLPIIAVGE